MNMTRDARPAVFARVVVALCALAVWPALRLSSASSAPTAFAGGCFWSMEHVFDELPGVITVTVGYAGGSAKNPSYEQVEAGITGHAESVQVVFDPERITYNALLDAYWHNIDPTDGAGQFCDHGTQYRPIIFYADEAQKHAAEASKTAIEQSHRFSRVMPQVLPAGVFWRAEDYHQHYYKTHAAAYTMYRIGCGRDRQLHQLWGTHE